MSCYHDHIIRISEERIWQCEKCSRLLDVTERIDQRVPN